MIPHRIAYVEDEPDIRELTEMALGTIGNFDVQTYASGSEALPNLASFDPDVVLLDVMMPNMDGPEVLQHMSNDIALADKPVIFITARSRPDELAEFLRLGAIGVVSKPYDPMTLSDEIRTICATISD